MYKRVCKLFLKRPMLLSRHGYEPRGYEAEAKPKLLSNHEAEAEVL